MKLIKRFLNDFDYLSCAATCTQVIATALTMSSSLQPLDRSLIGFTSSWVIGT
nr:hypothetical protein [Methanosarcina horonobensis]